MAIRIVHWLFIILFMLIGLSLTLGGGYLTYLGGSVYYVATGITLITVSVFMVKGNVKAAQLYGVLLGITLVWSLFESGLYLLALLPRMATWLGFGLWFITPWYQKTLKITPKKTIKNNDDEQKSNVKPWLIYPGIASVALFIVASLQGYEQNGTGTQRDISALTKKNAVTDWRSYGNTKGGTRFAELEQINTETVGKLTEVWRYRTGVDKDFKMTPLQVDNMLYICGAKNVLMAINSDTGEEIWRFDPKATVAAKHQYARTCRGISYHETTADYQGQCPTRIVTGTVDARLMTVNAQTGELCTDFGNNGIVDLRKGLGEHLAKQYYVTSPVLVADDVFVVGGLVLDSQDLGLPSGVVRAYYATTGEFAWAWDLGNPGYYGEPKAGETYTPGTPNVWSIMSYDAKLDLIYAPTGNANPDYFGGVRRDFDDEWSSSVVALSGATGEPKWKYQTVHHDIWDYDVPAQPVLVDVERAGEMVPSVAVPTKTGEIFLLDRRDGSPVHPIEERVVPQDPVIDEYLSATQPFSPLPNFHPHRFEKDMWGLTPVDQMVCRIMYKGMRYDGLFTPPTPGGSLAAPGNFGGFNWGSVSVDADNGILIAAPMLLAHRLIAVTPERVAEAGPKAALLLGEEHPAVVMDVNAVKPAPRDIDINDPFDHLRIKYYGLIMPFMSILGTQVPCFEPPWSRIAAIDLNTKELLWSRPLGSMKDSGPFGIRSGLPFDVGTAVRAGTLTTRGGLTFISSTMDSTVRAYDIRTGELKWSDALPGNGQATPMSYISKNNGKQYLIVTVPNPSWRYPRDPNNKTYSDSQSVVDGKGGYVIAYALDD
jgi:quinoprotein glucose dehydrogenase/quinate dehydrogenase (quinone)